jgi:hypothetical protein
MSVCKSPDEIALQLHSNMSSLHAENMLLKKNRKDGKCTS